MTGDRAFDPTTALRVALVLLALTAAIAIAVHLVAAADMRRLLDFGFGGVPPRLSTAAEIFASNARVLAGVVAACLAVQLGHAHVHGTPARVLLDLMRAVCDAALAITCALHVLVTGAAYGAYGWRTVTATLTHGPVELAAFSVVLALYISSRRAPVPPRTLATTALTALTLLALAALLEAFA